MRYINIDHGAEPAGINPVGDNEGETGMSGGTGNTSSYCHPPCCSRIRLQMEGSTQAELDCEISVIGNVYKTSFIFSIDM